LFSAARSLDPVTVAPARFGTEAVYSPPLSSTLPVYCVPPTVVEKLVAISPAIVLLFSEAKPPPLSDSRRGTALAGALALLEVEADTLVLDEALAGAVETAAPGTERGEGPETNTGLNVVALEFNVEAPISIFLFLPFVFLSLVIFPKSFIGEADWTFSTFRQEFPGFPSPRLVMPESARVVIACAVHNLSRIALYTGIRRRSNAFA
jgi:hypothetical protein